MIILYILLGLLALVLLFLMFSAVLYVEIKDEVSLKVGYMGLKFKIPLEKSEDKPEKKKTTKKKKGVKEKLPEKEPSEKSFSETVEFAVTLAKSVLPNAVKLLSRLRFTKVKIYMTVASEDADDTAVNFGRVSAGIYNLLGIMDNAFTLKIKSVDIVPDFVTGEAQYDVSFKVKLRLIHVLAAGAGMFFKFVVNTIKKKDGGGEKASELKNKPTA